MLFLFPALVRQAGVAQAPQLSALLCALVDENEAPPSLLSTSRLGFVFKEVAGVYHFREAYNNIKHGVEVQQFLGSYSKIPKMHLQFLLHIMYELPTFQIKSNVSMTVCKGVGKQLYTLPSHPKLDEAQVLGQEH